MWNWFNQVWEVKNEGTDLLDVSERVSSNLWLQGF